LPEFKRLTLPAQRDVTATRIEVHAIIVNSVSHEPEEVEKPSAIRWCHSQLGIEEAIVYRLELCHSAVAGRWIQCPKE